MFNINSINNRSLDISNVSMPYRDGPLFLKDISLIIKGGESDASCFRYFNQY